MQYSLSQGFYCDTEDEFDGLCKKIRQQFMRGDVQTPIFEVHKHRLPVHITSLSSPPGLCLRIYLYLLFDAVILVLSSYFDASYKQNVQLTLIKH